MIMAEHATFLHLSVSFATFMRSCNLQAAFLLFAWGIRPYKYSERRRNLAISRARKEELVAKYVETLSSADGFIVAEYTAMTVAESEQLRHKLRENQGEFMVTKNTLFKIALEQAELPVPEDLLVGPVGVAISKGNLPGMTKAVIDFAKDFEEKFAIKGGVMGTSVFQAGDVDAISKLPTLEELYPQIIGMLVQPQQGLVNTLQAANGSVVNVLQPGISGILNVLQAHITQNLQGDGEAAEAA